MKSLARSFIYWPGIDSDIESAAKSCAECARHAHAPPKFIKVTNSSTTDATIKILDESFAIYGILTTIISNNDTQNRITFHKLSVLYHPATNGQVKRYIQTAKAMSMTKNSLQTNLNYYDTRNLRTSLDLVRPQNVSTRIS
ncbi:hypothetical protein ACFW04_007405 [Cataglyphis niger]